MFGTFLIPSTRRHASHAPQTRPRSLPIFSATIACSYNGIALTHASLQSIRSVGKPVIMLSRPVRKVRRNLFHAQTSSSLVVARKARLVGEHGDARSDCPLSFSRWASMSADMPGSKAISTLERFTNCIDEPVRVNLSGADPIDGHSSDAGQLLLLSARKHHFISGLIGDAEARTLAVFLGHSNLTTNLRSLDLSRSFSHHEASSNFGRQSHWRRWSQANFQVALQMQTAQTTDVARQAHLNHWLKR